MGQEPPKHITAAGRKFLAAYGKWVIATPPSVALMLCVTDQRYAVAASGGHANDGYGNGGNDVVPGNSNHQDNSR